jgi:hypothetical protein
MKKIILQYMLSLPRFCCAEWNVFLGWISHQLCKVRISYPMRQQRLWYNFAKRCLQNYSVIMRVFVFCVKVKMDWSGAAYLVIIGTSLIQVASKTYGLLNINIDFIANKTKTKTKNKKNDTIAISALE